MQATEAPIAGAWDRFLGTRDPRSREILIHHYHHLAERTRRRLVPCCPARVLAEDLDQEACIGLIDAIDRFDPSRGVKFSTWAIGCMRFAILDHLRRDDDAPKHRRERERTLATQERRLERTLGRPVTDQDRADALGVDLTGFYDFSGAAYIPEVMSLDEPAGHQDDDSCLTVGDTVESTAQGPLASLMARQSDRAVDDIARTLNPQDAAILRGFCHGDRAGETAEQLGLTLNELSAARAALWTRLRRQYGSI